MTFDGTELVRMTSPVHISKGNTKLGALIPAVDLPAGVTCRPDAPCAGAGCYAMKGRFIFKKNRDLREHNLSVWQEEPGWYEYDVTMSAVFVQFFRFHSSGDIPDPEYLKMMVRVAIKCPGTKFLCFTKRYEWVNALHKQMIAEDGQGIPQNLHIVFSAWGDDWKFDNPYGFPVAYVRLPDRPCSVPFNAKACPGSCAECAITDGSCWKMDRGCDDCVVFNKH